MNAVIFAGGELVSPTEVKKKLPEAPDLVICADSGMKYAEIFNMKPDVIVGDFDSYTEQLPEDTKIIRCVPEKDDTDTLMAVKLAIERGCTEIFLAGGLGGRFDHGFANIQTLIYAYSQGCGMCIIDGDNEIYVQGTGRVRYDRQEGWYFSVFALTPELEIASLSGVRYPLEGYVMTPAFPIGVSNEIIGEFAELYITGGIGLVVYSRR